MKRLAIASAVAFVLHVGLATASPMPMPTTNIVESTTACVYDAGVTAQACSIEGTTYLTPSATDYDRLYELGHQFDWQWLTPVDREYLAWDFRLGHRQWDDTQASIDAGYEDGIEGVFPMVFAQCVEHPNVSVKGMKFQFTATADWQPIAIPRTNACLFIESVAATHN